MEKNGSEKLAPALAGEAGSPHSTLNGTLASSPLGRIRVVLCEPRHPGNIGAVARAMKTMGLSRLFLVRPERMAPGLVDAEAEARASGAGDLLAAATFCDSLDAALSGVGYAAALTARAREIGPPDADARDGAQRLVANTARTEVALVLGNESSGLRNEQVMRCNLRVFIPTAEDFSSLNIAAAAQVLCYEIRQAALGLAPQSVPVPTIVPAPRDDVERFFSHLQRSMEYTGFLDPAQPRRLLPKLRRLFGRSELEVEEINILRGFLSSVDALQQKSRSGS